MTDDELEARQQFLADELSGGCYPVQDTIAELCALVVEWTSRKRQGGKVKPEWEVRDKAAREVMRVLGQAKEQIGAGNSEAAFHCVFTAANIFMEAGLSKFARTGAKVNKGAKNGHEKTHGTEEEKEQRFKLYRSALQEKINDPNNKYKYITALRTEVADFFGVSLKTIERHTKDVEDTRKRN